MGILRRSEILRLGTIFALILPHSHLRYNVLQLSQGLEDFGSVRWPLFGCLALSWTCVFLCIFKGVQSSGKVRRDLSYDRNIIVLVPDILWR